jgi:hypothetical protein
MVREHLPIVGESPPSAKDGPAIDSFVGGIE